MLARRARVGDTVEAVLASPLLRRPLLELYGMLALGDTIWSGTVPLSPVYRDHLGLTATMTGVLVAVYSVAVCLVSLPAGAVADRFGARRVTLASSAVMTGGVLLQSFPDSLGLLMAGRALTGLGFGALWVAGVTLIGQVAPPELRSRALSATIVIAGVGVSIGPAYAGAAVDALGLVTPFLLLAAASGALTVALASAPSRAAVAMPARASFGTALRLSRRDTLVLAGLTAMSVPAFINNATNFQLSLDLAARGVSTARTGLVFAAGAIAFTVAGALVTRRAERLANVTTAAITTAIFASLLALPLASASPILLTAFVLARAPVAAILFCISVPLANRGADRAGIGSGAVLGLLNVVWAISAVVAPVAAGLLADSLGRRSVYAGLVVACAVGASAFLALRRQSPIARSVVEA